MREPHNRIDVNVFKELTKKKYYSETISSGKALLKRIENIHQSELVLEGFNLNKHEEKRKINVAEFGFKEFDDTKFEFAQDVFNNITKMSLKPTKIYELEENLDIPGTINLEIQAYCHLLSDSVERIKTRAEYILNETEKVRNIELYAKKNILVAHNIFNKTLSFLQKAQNKKNCAEILVAFIQCVYISYIISYLQDMFNAFYKSRRMSKKTLRNELYEVVNLKTFLELSDLSNCSFNRPVLEKGAIFQWNGPINRLVTLFYDLMNEALPNKEKLLDGGVDDLKFVLTNFFTDKKGDFIKDSTIDTYMKEYRDDKRAKGKKRIEILNYKN